MIRINLLPHREERRKARRQQFYALAGLVTAAAGLIWFLGHTLIDAMVEHQAEKNRFLESEIAALDKQIGEIKKLKEQTEALLQRKQVIESLQANRSEIVHLFNELAKRVPTGLFLRTIKQEGQKITLTGYAQANARVSTLMRNLDDSPLLERPELIEIKAAQVGKQRLNEFALSIFLTRQIDGQDASGGAKKTGEGK
ncbi:MAG: PilN domain-containing protein [Rhodocyclaceae bacterium]